MKRSAFKKLAAAVFAVIMVVSLLPAALAAGEFTVTPQGTWPDLVIEGYSTPPSVTYTVKNTRTDFRQRSYEITLSGENASDFTVNPATVSKVRPGRTGEFTISLNAVPGTVEKTTPFTVSFTVSELNSRGGSVASQTFGPITVMVAPQSSQYSMSVAPISDWPDTVPGNTDTKVTYRITNTGTGALTGVTAALSGTNAGVFTKTNPSANIPVEGSADFTVTLPASQAVAGASYSATLTVSATGAVTVNIPISVTVSANTSSGISVTPGTWPAGDLPVGYTDQTVTYTIKNNGAVDVSGIKIQTTGVFTVSTDTIDLEAGETKTFTVTFPAGQSANANAYKGVLTVKNSEGTQTFYTENLSCTVKNSVKVRFMNGNVQIGPDQDVATGTGHATAPATTPTRNADNYTYTFVGWSTAGPQSGANAYILGFNGVTDTVNLATATFASDTTLYAIYKRAYNTPVNISGDCLNSDGQTLSDIEDSSGDSIFENLADAAWYYIGNTYQTSSLVFQTTYSAVGELLINSQTTTGVGSSRFYFYSSSYGRYPLTSVFFYPKAQTGVYTATYTATDYYGNSMSGTITINLKPEAGLVGTDIVYNTRTGIPVAIVAADIEDYFKKTYASYPLNYVTIDGLPASGDLYYNYGAANATKLTASNYQGFTFYKNPQSTSYYSLYQLSYVPYSTNYTVVIPFTAYYNSTIKVSGTIAICVSSGTYSDVYIVTTRNTPVALSAASFNTTVNTAANSYNALSYIKFLDLPAAAQGTLYYNYSSTSYYTTGHAVSTANQYTYAGGSSTYAISNISFVPSSYFIGNLTVPYAAYNSNGTLLYVGKLSIGVVNTKVSYTDVAANAWYYKYVTELSDAGVVNGYPGGTFRPEGNVTYGETLKLILVAAGYGTQNRTSAAAHWASGYLKKAVELGIYTQAQANALKLDTPISRLEAARIAYLALRLGTPGIATPFADTSDAAVLALYQVGILEGSFNASGQRYYYPGNNITRAEISAVIWRLNNYS